jgi:deoxyxylulose-5-phosphate synthase
MTPKEYKAVWADFLSHDDPMIVSEHRASFTNTEELDDVIHTEARITLYPISATRFAARKAVAQLSKEGIVCNIVNILWLKPFIPDERLIKPLLNCKRGLVIDAGYEIAGASQSIAYMLTQVTGVPVRALGLEDRTKCLCAPFKNEIPSAERIAEIVRAILIAA